MDKNTLKENIEQYIYNLKISIESFELYKGIKFFVSQYKKEINYIASFLHVTLISLQTTFIMETVKLVDQREKKNIFNLLNVCAQNSSVFPKEIAYGGLNDDTDKKENYMDKIDVENDIQKCKLILNEYNDLIINLKGLRDKYYAHIDKEYFFEQEQAFKDFSINNSDFEMFLNDLLKILNMLLKDLCGEVYLIMNEAVDDVENILMCIRNNK